MTSTPGSGGHAAKRMRLERSAWRGSNDILPLRKYTPTPTNGTAPLHSSHDYGYADFYPAKSTQGETVLSERSIRYGYVDTPRVENEHVSHHEVVYDRLLDSRVFQELQAFAAGVAQRQWARGGASSSELPRLPNRSVHTDERREEWLRGLANPRLPLSILANSMPYGHRGERLLESLCAHRVPLQRAMWAIRLTGVYEMFGQQTRVPDHTSLKSLEQTYTVQWTKTFTQFLEHTLSSAPTGANEGDGLSPAPATISAAASVATGASSSGTPLLSPSASASGVSLAARDQQRPQRQPMCPDAWSQSWTFCLSLLHAQYDQGLLDQRHLVSWLVSQFRQTPLDKCMLLLPLVENYTSEISKSRNPLRKLIHAAVYRIDQTANYASLGSFRGALHSYLVSLFTKFPDAFVEPSTWNAYRLSLEQASGSCGAADKTKLSRMLAQVDARNSKFAHLTSSATSPQPGGDVKAAAVDPLSPLHILAAVTPDADASEVFNSLFGAISPCASVAAHIVRVICYWAAEDETVSAATQFRSLVAARVIRRHLDSVVEHSAAKEENGSGGVTTNPHAELQSAIVGFLDIFVLPADEKRARGEWRVCFLIERLADAGCFSISKYLQILTARGDFFGSNIATARSQRHLAYATHLAAGSLSYSAQTEMLLYGFEMADDAVSSGAPQQPREDTVACSKLKQEISATLPFLVAYTCATSLRARSNGKAPTIDTATTQWWMPTSGSSESNATASTEAASAQSLPTAKQLSGNRLLSPLALEACTKDWISPVSDHIADERLLNKDISPRCLELLSNSPRNVVDLVVRQRLLPIVYDFVVKDIKVGVDNWRVITQPGTSLLNGRQTAAIVRILSASGFYSQLLDFILWTLNHTKAAQVLSIAHSSLRQFTRVWKLVGRMSEAISQVDKVYASNRGGSTEFDFETYRTAEHWCASDCGEQAGSLLLLLRQDYDSFVDVQVQSLLQPSHSPSQVSTSKEILQLAQRLTHDRLRDSAAASPDETEWAVQQCFQKLSRWAQGVAHKGDFGNSPGLLADIASSPPGGSPRGPRLQSILSHIVSDATQAALVASKSLALAPHYSPDRARDDALLRCYVELCAQYVSSFVVSSGLALSPELVGSLLLKSLAASISSWVLSRNSSPTTLPVPASTVASPLFSVSEIEMAMQISYIWVTSLVSSGCLRISDLVPWLIERLRGEVTQQSVAQYACFAGIVRALGAPTMQPAKAGDAQHMESGGGMGSGSSGGSDLSDTHRLYELLRAGSSWDTALDSNRLCRIQAVELVFTCASAGGRLRGVGASQLEVALMRATTAFAQSAWIQNTLDYIPMSDQDAAKADNKKRAYYTMLEIYRANIEGMIRDPSTILPVKRATLRSLLTLCEGVDPESEGFSAMTTAEVAHRLRETIRRFWYGPAAKGKSSAEVYKCATILNSLLLFASTALQESEATTDAFAVAAGATAMSNSSIGGMSEPHTGAEAGANMQDIDNLSQCLSHGSEQVQFFTNTTAYLATCVQDAILNWSTHTASRAAGARSAADLRYDSLAEALSTLSPDILLRLIEPCSAALFSLNAAHLRVVGALSSGDNQNKEDAHAQRQQRSMQPSQGSPPASASKRVSAIIKASQVDVASLLSPPFTGDDGGMDDDEEADGDLSCPGRGSFDDFALRGSALARLIQRLMATLVDHLDAATSKESPGAPQQQKQAFGDENTSAFAPGSLLSSIRDIAGGLVGQLQTLAASVNPLVASSLSLSIVSSNSEQVESTPRSETDSGTFAPVPSNTFVDAQETISGAEDKQLQPRDQLDPQRLCLAIYWRLQAAQPLCCLMRKYPDEFAVDEWLMALVTLCLAPACQVPLYGSGESTLEAGFYQFLLDFTAVTNESVTATMRKRTLGLLRSVAPLLRSAVRNKHCADVLGRLFPFDMSTTLTRDLQPLVSATHVAGLDNPWIWIESLEYAPLASLNSAPISNPGLEGMTPFTLRGTLAQETAVHNGRTGAGVGQSGVARCLQYLNNPYFPMQPSFLLPLAETPIPWQLFGGKRRRLDSETRLVWRYRCKSAFEPE
ncbi:hypothetical protein GQ54DRAFT_297716 [Martensiomyces pterosporus]|nr:hypothetical protein GQ54DRAFT_297716 [Martensiomyces pterosporus]